MMLRPPTVLVYHAVADAASGDDAHRLVLAPSRFERQLTLLRAAGYRFMLASELSAQAPPSPGIVALTFDDGWRADVAVVAPALARAGARGTFFVCPGWLGGHHPEVEGPAGELIDAEGVAALAADGHEVGCHSWQHRDLRALSDAELDDDLARSRHRIEELTGRPCSSFAYPYGLFDDRVADAVRRAGFRLAFAWGTGPWRPFAVPRLPAPPRHGAMALAAKLLGVRRRVA